MSGPNDLGRGMTAIHHAVKVGDLFAYSWGYDQTNVDFYEVVAVLPKSVKVRAIGQEAVPGSEGFMSARVKARPGAFISDEVLTKRVRQAVSTWPVTISFPHGIGTLTTADKSHYVSWYA